MKVAEQLAAFVPEFETYLNNCTANYAAEFAPVYEAMRYSLLSGGKRLRPFILKLFYELNGGAGEDYKPFAAALEMIQTYSLIHDDLPCMDDDDLRRGRPSCHIAFGEANALLAGDALLTLAFQTAAGTKNIAPGRVLRAVALLAECAGASGMIGGQTVDLAGEKKPLSLPEVQLMYQKKTAELLRAAAGIGTVLAGGNEEDLQKSFDYAEALGMAFQIKDDLLDLTGDEKLLGKPVGSDEKNQKNTYVALSGVPAAEQAVADYTAKAAAALSSYRAAAEPLQQLADLLLNRQQ